MIKYIRNIQKADDDRLIEQHEELIALLTAGQGTTLDKPIKQLLEIERELTLRENN